LDNYTVVTDKKLFFSAPRRAPVRFLAFGAVGRDNPDFQTGDKPIFSDGHFLAIARSVPAKSRGER
jgi:hypothetical protein